MSEKSEIFELAKEPRKPGQTLRIMVVLSVAALFFPEFFLIQVGYNGTYCFPSD